MQSRKCCLNLRPFLIYLLVSSLTFFTYEEEERGTQENNHQRRNLWSSQFELQTKFETVDLTVSRDCLTSSKVDIVM